MRTVLMATAAVLLFASAAQAAPARQAPARKATPARPMTTARDAQTEFTTPSPAGYVYRRVPQTLVAEAAAPVGPAEVVVPNQRARNRRAARQPFRNLGAAANNRGAMSMGVGVNVGAIPSSNRTGGQ